VPARGLTNEVHRGLELNVPGRELRLRLTRRIQWHQQKTDMLITQMRKVMEVEREAGDDLLDVIGRYETPRLPLKKRLTKHQERAAFLAFIRDRLVDAGWT